MTLEPHILVVDDDTRLRSLLKKYLSGEGFVITCAANAQEARQALDCFRFDGAVLDVMMPGESGLQLAQSLSGIPILMLSALGEAKHRIGGLEAGALDYLPKPFEPKELGLRLRNILRRGDGEKTKNQARFGPYCFDHATLTLRRGEEEVPLTTGEAQLLEYLLEHAGTPVSREALSRLSHPPASERSVDVQITRLRRKLSVGESSSSLIRTVRGAGYVIHTD